MSAATRRGVTKKPSALVRERVARLTMNSVSKAALLDFAADMLRRVRGDEHLDGEALAAAFVEEYEPVAIARGDMPPRVRS